MIQHLVFCILLKFCFRKSKKWQIKKRQSTQMFAVSGVHCEHMNPKCIFSQTPLSKEFIFQISNVIGPNLLRCLWAFYPFLWCKLGKISEQLCRQTMSSNNALFPPSLKIKNKKQGMSASEEYVSLRLGWSLRKGYQEPSY